MNSSSRPEIHIIGGGLAGVEAAYQCLRRGLKVTLYEMRPARKTPAHQTGDLAELVCSNSFKSDSLESAPGQLKWEMASLGSLVVEAANSSRVPAGQALAVDRVKFSAAVKERLHSFTGFTLEEKEVTQLPPEEEMARKNQLWLMATGPLTAEPLARALSEMSGLEKSLYFYDAIAPIIDAQSINMDEGYWANRWDKGEGQDYFNIPLDKEQYEDFVQGVIDAEKMPLHDFEKVQYFESCLPIEVMAGRGKDTLRFGPMKPVGLIDKRTNKRPWAVIQLRRENDSASMLSMVGFQTKMKWPEQKRLFSKLPCLKEVEIYRYGSVHRNTYVEAPRILSENFSLKKNNRLFLAGQITGVEGYTESAGIGLLAGICMVDKALGRKNQLPPKTTLLGALGHYVLFGSHGKYQPMNAHFGLLPTIERKKGVSKSDVKIKKTQLAKEAFKAWDTQLEAT